MDEISEDDYISDLRKAIINKFNSIFKTVNKTNLNNLSWDELVLLTMEVDDIKGILERNQEQK